MQQRTQHAGSAIESMTMEPGFSSWMSALSTINDSEAARADRAMLGIPTDRAVLMSGHQPIVFHPGIAAKLAALMIASEQTGAEAVWIVPDQDAADTGLVRIAQGRGATLNERLVRLHDEYPPQTAIASIAPIETAFGVASDNELPDELVPIVDRLNEQMQQTEQSRACQFANATLGFASDWLGVRMPRVILASDLVQTTTFQQMLQAMTDDPERCVRAYNDACAAFPDAGVRALSISNDQIELPLWRVAPGKMRAPVFADELGDKGADATLLPRGLVMTAVARAALCELFIHGAGGWAYDRITEHWMREWMGDHIAPIALVTATQLLDDRDELPAEDPDHALWIAHHAKHDPSMLDDSEADNAKRALVAEIEMQKQRYEDPSGSFNAMHELLAAYRDRHAEALRELEITAERAQAHRQAFKLANDRTWPIVNFDPESGLALTQRVRESMR